MAWGRIDDKLHENPKVWTVGTAAMGLWVLANSWCCDNPQANGFVPLRVLYRWRDQSINDDVEATADRLVDGGLWHHAKQGGEVGYLFHDWDEYRPESARSSHDAQRGNHVRWHANLGVVKEGCAFCATDSVSAGQTQHIGGDVGATSGRIGGDIAPVPVPEPVPEPENPLRASDDAQRADAQDDDAQPEPSAPPDRFEEFWDTYDKKLDRKRAEQKYRVALKKPGVTPDLLIDSARQYVAGKRAAGKHPDYTKNAGTWLNGENWNDETLAPPAEVHRLPHVSELEEPPDGLTDAEYEAWMRRRHA